MKSSVSLLKILVYLIMNDITELLLLQTGRLLLCVPSPRHYRAIKVYFILNRRRKHRRQNETASDRERDRPRDLMSGPEETER